MTNLNLSWGKKQMLFMIPIMVIGFLPILRMTFFKGDAIKELTLSEIQSRPKDQTLEIIGLIKNTGRRDWTNITIEAEFFDEKGVFLDEASGDIRSEVNAGASEHFKVDILSPPAIMADPKTKMVVKVSGALSSPF